MIINNTNNTDFDIYSDFELLNLWNSLSLDSIKRLYLYNEFLKRNKLFLLNQKYLFNNSDEHICYKIRTGIPYILCLSSNISILIMWVLFFLPILIFSIFELCYTFNFPYYNFISENTEKIVRKFFILPSVMVYVIPNILMSSYIILTNKKIYINLKFFFGLSFLYKSIKLDNIIISEIKSFQADFLRYYLRNFSNNTFSFISYWINIKNNKILQDWIYVLSVNKFKSFFGSTEFINSETKVNNHISNYQSYLLDFYYTVKNLSSDNILKAYKDKYLVANFKNLVEYLSSIVNKVKFNSIIETPNSDYLLENEFTILLLPTFNLNLLLVTNLRLIHLTKKYLFLNSYYYSDKKLKLVVISSGFKFFYKYDWNNIFTVPWIKINIPFIELLKFLGLNYSFD
jgi:hypothetical protein